MKTKFFLTALLAFALVIGAQAQKSQSGKALIINTSSEKEIAKIKQALKDADPSTYRLTITTTERGKTKTTTLGSAPIKEVSRISSAASLGNIKGGYAAADIVILVKNITSSSVLRDNVLKQLNADLSKSATMDLNYQVTRANQLRVSSVGRN